MKKTIRAFALLLCLALLCALGACADQGDTAAAPADAASLAGEYSFFCARFSPAYLAALFDYDGELPDVGEQYVLIPQMEGQTVTLDPGGKGSLDWGEDNRGPISQWSAEGDRVEIRAGVSVMEGTVQDGIMVLEIEDGFAAYFVLPGADTSHLQPISVEACADLLYGTEAD